MFQLCTSVLTSTRRQKMNVGAINSVNFTARKPEIIDIPEEDYEIVSYDITEETDRFERAAELANKLVKNDEKGFFAKAATIAGIGATSFAKGASVTAGIDKLSGDKASELFENGLKKGSEYWRNASKALKTNKGKKFSKLANSIGKILEKGEELARNSYKSLSAASKKVVEEVAEGDNIKQITKKIKSHSAGKGLAVIMGIASTIALAPGLLKKDNNEDGIADFKQKSQNVYAKNSKAIDAIGEKATIAVEIAQLLT